MGYNLPPLPDVPGDVASPVHVCPPNMHWETTKGCVFDNAGAIGRQPKPGTGTGDRPVDPTVPGDHAVCRNGGVPPGCACAGGALEVNGQCPGTTPDPTTGGGGGGPCPEGEEHGGGHPGNPCRPIKNAGGGGGGGGGGSAAAPLVSGVQPGDDVEKQIWDYIQGILSGKNTAYSPEVVQNMKNSAFETSMGRAAADKQSLSDDLVSRGIFRSGIAAGGMSAIDRSASAEYSKGARDINTQKALSDFSNRMQALTAAQQWLDSKRTYLIQKESNAIQREIGLAQIKLGYAKIASEKELLQLQLAKMGGGGGGDNFDPFALVRAINCAANPTAPGCGG